MLSPRRAPAALALLLSAALLAGCSGGEDDAGDGDAPDQGSAAPGVATKASLGVVRGTFTRSQGNKLVGRIQQVVDRWIDAAYLGDYPRSDFDSAFADFTPGATRQAQGDLDLLTNAGIGEQIDGATAVRRALKIDVLGHKGRAAGVTARANITYDTTGERAGRHSVGAQLYLTYTDGGWQIFGYDVTRGKQK